MRSRARHGDAVLRVSRQGLRRGRRNERRPGRGTSRNGVLAGLVATLALPALLLAAVIATDQVYRSYVNDAAPPQDLAVNQLMRGARIYDRNGMLLYEFLDEREGQRLPVALENVAPTFLAATIATEDESFFSNPGLNLRGLMRAGWENFRPLLGSHRSEALAGSGGSSITQQLVKNVYIPETERAERKLERKLKEAVLALDLTKHNSKTQILEWYVNQISYGGVYSGVEAASQGYFGKPASELTLAEAALLAGIPQSPARYDPISRPEAALVRRNEILDLVELRGTVQIGEDAFFTPSPEELQAARETPLRVQTRVYPIEAPHFVLNHVAPQLEALFGRSALYRDGLVVRTTLDLGLQRSVAEILDRWIREFEGVSNSHNGAVLVIDAPTGELLSVIGSRDYFREDISGNVDNLTALNSPGSSFKPFVYLSSFLKLGWGPLTVIEDSPVVFRESNGQTFQPLNPIRNSYQGRITIAKALGNSLNVPAFKTALALGPPAIVDVAKQAGFTTLHGQYGPAISIGGVDLTALDLAYGYSVLANNGRMVGQVTVVPHDAGERAVDPIAVLRVEDGSGRVLFDVEQYRQQRQVIPADKAYQVTSILSDPSNQCITFGCGGISIPGRVAAVKTGTSEPFDPRGPHAGKIGETWAFGYTPDYVVGVWAGNSDNTPVVNILSTSISFRVMRDSLQAAYGGRPSGAFARPPDPAPESFVRAAVAKVTPARGKLVVHGYATSRALRGYRLEVSSAASPGSWRIIGHGTAPVQDAQLGELSTKNLSAGLYNLRVVVIDAFAGEVASPTTRLRLGR
jgi:membrane peptidoglycan carboxypeptidase